LALIWLVLSIAIANRDMFKMRYWHVIKDRYCKLYPGRMYEDINHLFFECKFSRIIWTYLQIDWSQGTECGRWLYSCKETWTAFLFSGCFSACWHIWKIRNGEFSDKRDQHLQPNTPIFIHDMTLHIHRFNSFVHFLVSLLCTSFNLISLDCAAVALQ
jgi:hypothetical protein